MGGLSKVSYANLAHWKIPYYVSLLAVSSDRLFTEAYVKKPKLSKPIFRVRSCAALTGGSGGRSGPQSMPTIFIITLNALKTWIPLVWTKRII